MRGSTRQRLTWRFGFWPIMGLAFAAHASPDVGAGEPDAASTGAEAAREEFLRGSEHARKGDCSSAIERYRASYALFRHATTLYNIAFCAARGDDPAAAMRELGAALELGDREPDRSLDEEQRRQAEVLLRELEGRVARLELDSVPPGTQLWVDGHALRALELAGSVRYFADTSPGLVPVPLAGRLLLVLNAGSRRLTWRTPAGPGSRVVVLEAGSKLRLELVVAPSHPRETNRGARFPTQAPATPRQRGDVVETLGIVGLVSGGGLLAVSLGAGLSAVMTKAKLDTRCGPGGACPPSQSERLERMQTATTVANVAFLSGAVFAAAGGAILLLRPSGDHQVALQLRAAPGIEVAAKF